MPYGVTLFNLPIFHIIYSRPVFANQIDTNITATGQMGVESDYLMMWGLIFILSFGLGLVILWNHRLRQELIAHSQIEQDLTKSQFLLKEAQQMAHVGNWELDPVSLKAIWSDEVFRTIGMAPRDDVGPECLATIIHSDDKTAVLSSLKHAIENGDKHHIEYRIIRPNGEIRWLDCRAEQIWDDNGELLKLRGVIQDITERKLNELQLKEREQQVRDLLNSTAEAIYGLDEHGLCTFANPACVQMLGYQNAEQLIGCNMHELIHHTKIDGSTYPEQQCPILNAFINNSGTYVDNEVFWRADGSSFQVEYWSYPIHRDDKVTGSVVAFWDISQRLLTEAAIHDSEERYRIIFEGAPEGVWLIGADRSTIEVNKRLCDLLGYSKDEMVGKKPTDFVDEVNKKIFIAQTNQIEITNRREYEIELRHKKGHNIPTYFRANTVHTSSGEVLEAVAFVTDLSEQKIAEKALRRVQKMDALGQLTGGIAHDFNNILSIVLGNLTLLKNHLKYDEKASKRVKTIEKSARRAADLTKQLLGFSRRQAAQVVNTDINRIITDMNSLIARSITPEVNILENFSDDLWLTKIDPGDFEDALLNLVFNARDAMLNGGRLILETKNKILDESYCSQNVGAVAGEYVQLIISDSGQGISIEQQEHIFDPFYTTKPQGKGTGLGLPMVYGFVKRSKGYIKVYSEPGIGTTFRLYLPRTQGEEQQLESSIEVEETLPTGHETILIVDDEKDLLELAEEALQELGYKVHTAENARQALKCLSEETDIQLLFSDVVMPGGVNGFELAEQALAKNPKLKILLTSGFTGKALAQNLINQKDKLNAEMLHKPYTQMDLAVRLRDVFGQPGNRGSNQLRATPRQEYNFDTKYLQLGIAEIDEDHKKIFDLLTQCREMNQQGATSVQIQSILESLHKFTAWHFPREEAVMAICDYPGLENHRQVHEMLTKQLEKLQGQFNQGTLTGELLFIFMNDWINDHIHSMDSSFVSYCEGKKEKIEQAIQQVSEKAKNKELKP